MNPLVSILSSIVSNPVTSIVGSGPLFSGLSAILAEMGSGKTLIQALSANNGQALVAVLSGFGLIFAKDGHK